MIIDMESMDETPCQDPTAKTDLLSFLELAQHQSKVSQQWFVWTDTLHTLDVMQVQKNPELFRCSQKASVEFAAVRYLLTRRI